MAEFPALPLFTDAWVADTKHLSRLERGTYHDLLVLMWRSPNCRVPNDDAWLARRLDMTEQEVGIELRPVIAEFCQTDGNWLIQKRLTKEWGWCRLKRQRNTVNGKSLKRNKKIPSERQASDTPSRLAPYPTLPYLEESKKDAADAAPSDLEKQLFQRGKEVAGKEAGGLIAKLLKAKKGNVALARAAIELAATKQNPREYIGAVIAGGAASVDGKRLTNDEEYWGVGRIPGIV